MPASRQNYRFLYAQNLILGVISVVYNTADLIGGSAGVMAIGLRIKTFTNQTIEIASEIRNASSKPYMAIRTADRLTNIDEMPFFQLQI